MGFPKAATDEFSQGIASEMTGMPAKSGPPAFIKGAKKKTKKHKAKKGKMKKGSARAAGMTDFPPSKGKGGAC